MGAVTGSMEEAHEYLHERHAALITQAVQVARELCEQNGATHSQAVRAEMVRRGALLNYRGTDHWLGAVFKRSNGFAKTGRRVFVRSEKIHKRSVCEWRLAGDTRPVRDSPLCEYEGALVPAQASPAQPNAAAVEREHADRLAAVVRERDAWKERAERWGASNTELLEKRDDLANSCDELLRQLADAKEGLETARADVARANAQAADASARADAWQSRCQEAEAQKADASAREAQWKARAESAEKSAAFFRGQARATFDPKGAAK